MPINIDDLKLEEFSLGNAALNTYYISITGNGTLTMYRGFYEKENLNQFNFARLFYDPTKKLLGIRFSEENPGKGSAKLNRNPDKTNAWIAANNFFTYYSLNPHELKGKYLPEGHEVPEKGKLYFIDLNSKIQSK